MARLSGGGIRAVAGAVLVAALLGGTTLVAGSGAGAATSVAQHALGRCTKSSRLPRGETCKTKTLLPHRTLGVTSDEVKVTPTGRGTVTVVTFATDPTGVLPSSTGKYFGVSLTPRNGFTNLLVKDCNLGGGTTLYWWNGDTWLPVALQPGSISSASLTCVSATLGTASSPTIATIVRLSVHSSFQAVVFGVK